MAQSISTEFSARIYNDSTGDYVQIGPDPDGLDLCQITKHEKGGPTIMMIIEWDVAKALAKSIFELRGLTHRAEKK